MSLYKIHIISVNYSMKELSCKRVVNLVMEVCRRYQILCKCFTDELPCNGKSTEGKTYKFGDTWTTESGHKCQCYAHGISNCDAFYNDDNK